MKNTTIFDDKDLSGLLKDIYKNIQEKKKDIKDQIDGLAHYIRNVQDAAILGPIIAEFLNLDIQNDENLVKVATVVQRLLSSEMQAGGADNNILSDSEKEQLLKNINAEIHASDDEFDKLKSKANVHTQGS